MKSDKRFDELDRFAPLFSPQPSFKGFLRRRDRKRRNQRIAAVVVAVVIAAPVWLAATGGPFFRTSTPRTTGPAGAPHYPDQTGLVGLPPKDAAPSAPTKGELVLSFMFGHTEGDPGRFSVHLYEDGRLITHRVGDSMSEPPEPSTGYLEQRLTPEGVELVRNEVISTGLFDDSVRLTSANQPGLYFGDIQVRNGDRFVRVVWGDISNGEGLPETTPTPEQVSALQRLDALLADPAAWLPASTWADQEIKAFVPAMYSVCYESAAGTGLSQGLAALPQPAGDVLSGLEDWRHSTYDLGVHYWCSKMPTDEVRSLSRILDRANPGHETIWGLRYVFRERDPLEVDVSLSFEPLLPHQG
ncbi:MAG: hypothetical protein WD757_05665 [Actinomycetota bacterium]